MSERLQYFFSALDAHLTNGLSPAKALLETVENYQYVFELQPIARQNTEESPGTDKQHAQAEICQEITEEIMMFMGGADMLTGCSTKRMVQIRNSIQSIVSGKLSAVR